MCGYWGQNIGTLGKCGTVNLKWGRTKQLGFKNDGTGTEDKDVDTGGMLISCQDRLEGKKREITEAHIGTESMNPENQQNGGLHFWSFQVTVGSGRPTARQYRLTFSPSFTDTSLEMLTILAGTGKKKTNIKIETKI